MNEFEAIARSVGEVHGLLSACLKDPADTASFVSALCHISAMQESQEPSTLLETVLIFTHRWRTRVNMTEFNNLLQISLAKVVMGQGEDWRRLLHAAIAKTKTE